jgi:Tol biopolymer transport system component
MAFIATDPQEGRGLYTYDMASKTLTRLTGGAETWPAWSLSGDHIAFYDVKSRVALYSVAGNDVRVLTKEVSEGLTISWTADGHLVFTQRHLPQRIWNLYSMETRAASKLDFAERNNLNLVDQQKFGWASTRAEQVEDANAGHAPR